MVGVWVGVLAWVVVLEMLVGLQKAFPSTLEACCSSIATLALAHCRRSMAWVLARDVLGKQSSLHQSAFACLRRSIARESP